MKQLKLMFWFHVQDMLKDLLRTLRFDEAGNVDVDEGGHQELAIESVHDATVSGNNVSEILKKFFHVHSIDMLCFMYCYYAIYNYIAMYFEIFDN